MYLNHITLSTGHIARTSRADVAPAVTALLAKWLPGTINSGKHHPLPLPDLRHVTAHVLEDGGVLMVNMLLPLGPIKKGKPLYDLTTPLVTFGVAARSRQGGPLWARMTHAFDYKPGLQQPGTPFCAVAIHSSIAMYTGPVEWLGDFERCVAWAWITRNPDLRAATCPQMEEETAIYPSAHQGSHKLFA